MIPNLNYSCLGVAFTLGTLLSGCATLASIYGIEYSNKPENSNLNFSSDPPLARIEVSDQPRPADSLLFRRITGVFPESADQKILTPFRYPVHMVGMIRFKKKTCYRAIWPETGQRSRVVFLAELIDNPHFIFTPEGTAEFPVSLQPDELLFLGEAYFRGTDRPKDCLKALHYFQEAALQGHANAMSNIGYLYYEGCGVHQDYAKAMEYFQKENEHDLAPETKYCIGAMYRDGLGVLQDPGEAFSWFLKSAQSGYTEAQYMVGNMYLNGVGIEKDRIAAAEWYEKSSKLGCQKSKESLSGMIREEREIMTANRSIGPTPTEMYLIWASLQL